MNVDDANKIFNYSPTEKSVRYAYYPNGSIVSGTIEYNGNTYTKAANDWRVARFYSSDGGGVEKVDSNGVKYREPETDNPVYVTQSYYTYTIEKTSSSITSILGISPAWLASQSIYANKNGVAYGIRTVSNKGVSAETLYDSYANTYNYNYGLHPVVEISDEYSIDFSDNSRNGSTSAKAWKIIKAD